MTRTLRIVVNVTVRGADKEALDFHEKRLIDRIGQPQAFIDLSDIDVEQTGEST